MQQFPFIDLFKSAVHVLGETVEMELSSISTVSPVGSRLVHCTKAVYTVKLLLLMGENIARNM
jgi:hypothetical protein